MRCLYEVLQVGRDADAHGIKQSYRAQALRLHPGAYINAHASIGKHCLFIKHRSRWVRIACADKNPGDETAYERFQELQQAYEVLSDPQARLVVTNSKLFVFLCI